MDERRTPTAHATRAGGTLGGLVLLGVPIRFHFTFLLLILFVVTASAGGSGAVWADAAFLAGAIENTIVLAPRYLVASDKPAENEVVWTNAWRSGGIATKTSSLSG